MFAQAYRHKERMPASTAGTNRLILFLLMGLIYFAFPKIPTKIGIYIGLERQVGIKKECPVSQPDTPQTKTLTMKNFIKTFNLGFHTAKVRQLSLLRKYFGLFLY